MKGLPFSSRALLRAALLLVLVALTCYAAWDYKGTRELTRLAGDARTAGEPLTVLDADGHPGLDVDPGAAPLYLAAAALARTDGKAFRAAADALDGLAERSAAQSQGEVSSGPARHIIDENALALDIADRAAPLSFRGFPPGTDYNYRWQHLHDLARISALRSALLALTGDPVRTTEAVASQLCQLRVFSTEGAMGDFAVAEGLRTSTRSLASLLERSTPTDEQSSRLDAAFASTDDDRKLVRSVLIHRAAALEPWLRYFGALPPSVGREAGGPGVVVWLVWLARPHIRDEVNDRLRLFRELLGIASLRPGARVLEGLGRIPADARRTSAVRPSDRDIVALTTSTAQRFFEGQAFGRVARAALAVERYRRTHNALPASLEQVRLSDGSALPPDPISGKALRLRAEADAYVIYSLGEDGKDDGGKIDAEKPQAAAPAWGKPRPSPDWGIRVRFGRGQHGTQSW